MPNITTAVVGKSADRLPTTENGIQLDAWAACTDLELLQRLRGGGSFRLDSAPHASGQFTVRLREHWDCISP